MSVKKSSQLILLDRLSRLTIQQVAKWLGAEGARLLKETGKWNVRVRTLSATTGPGIFDE
jgi:hypothetical protein